MTLCKFFAQGFCRRGDSCNFIHEPGTSTGQHLAPVTSVLLTTENLNPNPAAVTYRNEEAKPAQNCRFFLQGKCSKGKECRYIHLPAIPQQVHPDAVFANPPQLPPDSRATVPCRFLPRPGGCQNSSCPYLHVADEPTAEKSSSQDLGASGEEASSRFLTFGARINLIGRTKSARTTSFGIFQEPQSTSMKSATFSKSPSRLTSHLYASQALCQEPLPKQSSVSFAGSAST